MQANGFRTDCYLRIQAYVDEWGGMAATGPVGWDVIVNRPKVAAYRAPSAPMAAFAVESTMDLVAQEIGMDSVDFRLKNVAKEGAQSPYGPIYGPIGIEDALKAVKAHPHYKQELGPNQGRGVAAGFWFNAGMQSSATVSVNDDGSAIVQRATR